MNKMASETASSVDEQAQLVAVTSTDNRGRHRILAELNRLEQELKFLQVPSLNALSSCFLRMLFVPTCLFCLFEVPIPISVVS